MGFRLRYQQHNLELSPGQFLIGRSTECQLSLDDPLVSRRHARLVVTPNAVFVEDLGSRNGVLVGGVRIEGQRKLHSGERLTVGSQVLTLLDDALQQPAPSSLNPQTPLFGHATLTIIQAPSDVPSERDLAVPTQYPLDQQRGSTNPPQSEGVVRRLDGLRVLSGLADKAFALGRAEEAEKILSGLLQQVMEGARRGQRIDEEISDHAGKYAARLAGATGKGLWIDYTVELFTLQGRIWPALVVDELYSVLRKVGSINLSAFRAYVSLMRSKMVDFGPAERFLLQRMEGLERFAALK